MLEVPLLPLSPRALYIGMQGSSFQGLYIPVFQVCRQLGEGSVLDPALALEPLVSSPGAHGGPHGARAGDSARGISVPAPPGVDRSTRSVSASRSASGFGTVSVPVSRRWKLKLKCPWVVLRRPLGVDFHGFWFKFWWFGLREWFQTVRTAISSQFPVRIPRDLSPGPENGLVSFSWKYGNQLGKPYLDELPMFLRICPAQKVRMDREVISGFRQKLSFALQIQAKSHFFVKNQHFHFLSN